MRRVSYVPLHTISYVPLHTIRPPDESAYLKIIFLVSTQKTRLNETVLLGTQNTCFNWCVRKLLHFYPSNLAYLGLCTTNAMLYRSSCMTGL